MRFQRLIGLAGVHSAENEVALRWGARFERGLVAIALLIMVQWYVESVATESSHYAHIIDWLIWLFFLMELAVMCLLVDSPVRYLRGNWMNSVIVITGVPLLWQGVPLSGALRGLRLLLFIGLLPRLSRTTQTVLSRNKLGYTVLVVALFVVIAGLLISVVDPAIETPADGIWWALVTITTVGYGDVVPVSPAGRLFAGGLVIMGVILIAILTANVAAFLIDSGIDEEQKPLLDKITKLDERMQRIESLLMNNSVTETANRKKAQTDDEVS